MGVVSYLFAVCCPNSLGLIAANTYGQLSDSTLVRIFDVWEKCFGLIEGIHYVFDKMPLAKFKSHPYTFKSNNNKIFFENGAVIMLASLENYKAIDGRELGYALLDETKDTREVAIKDSIITRLRQPSICLSNNHDTLFKFVDHESKFSTGEYINPLFVFTSPAKEQWLSEWFDLEDYRDQILHYVGSKTDFFHVSESNRTIVIGSTYLNHHLPANYISDMISDLSKDQIDLNIYGSPFGKSGVEYYADFDRIQHVRNLEFDNRFAVHLGFDFNVHPYMTGLACQIIIEQDQRTVVRFLKGYPMRSPKNSIEGVCDAFLFDFEHKCQMGLFYYGDSTGKNSLPIAEYTNYFSIVHKKLSHLLHSGSRRLLKQNPRHKTINIGSPGRRDFMNKCLRGGYGFDIEIDESCKELIMDLEYLKEDANGAKMKEKELIEGVRCEKYGHFSDALDSIICFIFGDWSKD